MQSDKHLHICIQIVHISFARSYLLLCYSKICILYSKFFLRNLPKYRYQFLLHWLQNQCNKNWYLYLGMLCNKNLLYKIQIFK